MVTAKQLISKQFPVISREEKISKVLSKFGEQNVIIVMSNNDYQCVILKKDIIKPKLNLNTKVKTFLRHPAVLEPNTTMDQIARIMFESGIYTLPVKDKNKIKGVVTIDKILKEIQSQTSAEITVNNFISSNLITINSNESIGKVIKLLKEKNISCLPVYENDKIIGILTMENIINETIYPEHKAKGWVGYGELIAEKNTT